MIKNRETVNSLTLDDKLEMISDASSLAAENRFGGVPRVIPADLDGVNRAAGAVYPAYSFLANCWNSGLVSEISRDLALKAKAHGVNLLFTPEAKPKSSPYAAGVSEDPFYSGAFVFNAVKGIKDAGVIPCVTGLAVTDADAEYLDVFPDARAVYDYFLAPADMFSGLPANVFLTSYGRLRGKYSRVNCDAVLPYLKNIADGSGFVISADTGKGLAAESVAAGITFSYAGDYNSLKAAVENYNALKTAAERGDKERVELEAAVKSGEALSEAAVDEAVDGTIDFALLCNMGAEADGNGNTTDVAALSLQAAEECTTLLKNDGALPLRGGERIGVIGRPAFIPNAASDESFLQVISKSGLNFAGAAQGYTSANEKNDELIKEAVSLAKQCDTVLLFLGSECGNGFGQVAGKSLKLPGNALALISALGGAGAKIIAVLTSPESADVSFGDGVSALLISPVGCMRGGEALLNILRGKSPCGRLANTLYSDADGYFGKIKSDRDGGRIRIGAFLGYRYYKTARLAVKYPFGHGLSYTGFSYSDLQVRGGQILVTVKNTGKFDGCEVVQLYTGKSDSAVLRPAAELKSYIKIFLRAGETKTLCFRISPERLAVYSPADGKKIIEGGIYEIYVGSSVNDIKLSGKISVRGATAKPDGAKLSDYIPTLSNVVDGGYTLSPVQSKADGRTDGRKLKLSGLILMFAAALGMVIFAALNLVHVISFEADGAGPPVLTFIILLFSVAAALLIAGYCKSKAARAATASAPVSAAKPEAVKVKDDSIESLFEREFGEKRTDGGSGEDDEDDGEEERDGSEYTDDGLTIKAIAGNLDAFCGERGLSLKADGAAKIISALAAARIIFIKSAQSALVPKLLSLVSEFFRSGGCLADFAPCGSLDGFLNLGGGVLKSLTDAKDDKRHLNLICVSGADFKDLGGYFSPIARYAGFPRGGVAIDAEGGVIKLPENLWFVFAAAEEACLKDADITVAEYACAIDIDLAPAEESKEKTEFAPVSYYRFEYLSEAAKTAYALDEEHWKKVDKFERFISSRTPFALGNKVWRIMEKFVSAYLSCGGDGLSALDNMAAAKLMITACANLNGKLKPSDGSIASAAEEIFGEGNIPETKKILKHAGISAGRRAGNAVK